MTTWIGRWRRHLGRPVLAGVDDEPAWCSLVWRDNWRELRDEIARFNARQYPEIHDVSNRSAESKYLTPGNSMDAEIMALAGRLARAAGWPEELWETRGDRPGHWSKATLGAAMAIAKQAWTWADYIAERSGRKLQLAWGLYNDLSLLS